jgi:hypothetical protein
MKKPFLFPAFLHFSLDFFSVSSVPLFYKCLVSSRAAKIYLGDEKAPKVGADERR